MKAIHSILRWLAYLMGYLLDTHKIKAISQQLGTRHYVNGECCELYTKDTIVRINSQLTFW